MPSEKLDYIFVDDPTNDTVYAIRIISGPYVGTIYKYANIKINEDVKRDVCTLSYTYSIMTVPSVYTAQILESDKCFKNYIGDILSDILSNQEYKIGKHGE